MGDGGPDKSLFRQKREAEVRVSALSVFQIIFVPVLDRNLPIAISFSESENNESRRFIIAILKRLLLRSCACCRCLRPFSPLLGIVSVLPVIRPQGSEKYMDTKLLRQVNGVGPVTSLAYVLTLETPQRFKRSRDVGPYLGLVRQQEDSGDSQPQLGISKAGDRMLRKLLVGSAHYILGRTQTYDDSE